MIKSTKQWEYDRSQTSTGVTPQSNNIHEGFHNRSPLGTECSLCTMCQGTVIATLYVNNIALVPQYPFSLQDRGELAAVNC